MKQKWVTKNIMKHLCFANAFHSRYPDVPCGKDLGGLLGVPVLIQLIIHHSNSTFHSTNIAAENLTDEMHSRFRH